MMAKLDDGPEKKAAKGIQSSSGVSKTGKKNFPMDIIGDAGFDEAIDLLIDELKA